MPAETIKYGFNSEMEGRFAEFEGGAAAPGGMSGHRDFFAGRLTGHYFDEGEPPLVWRWYLMTEFTKKPEDYTGDAIWCEETFLFLNEK